ncbi:DUF4352 domain-containing protein [Domibacillus sp. A3M-37]|uniref:DUF4352 domain-containing protein n=1 Tax=Domibacillus sp. A3M-37 TaxID=2962037 RepID=UPI0020B8E37D|nr:DUF4352 domain-containing protein [Domibacillus sp. A3M-37]MCP3761677.1 DUF4352 domain-containing protein [Domibacillus sp. A3M-37]
MKRLSWMMAAMLLAAGCSNNSQSLESPNEAEPAVAVETEAAETKEAAEYVPNPQVTDDQTLLKEKQAVSDGKGELMLLRYQSADEQVQVGPVQVTLNEAKVMHFTPDYSMIDFFHMYTHEEQFDFVKISVTFENTSDEPVQFNPAAHLKTSAGELKTWEDDFYLEELASTLKPSEIKSGSMGFIVEKGETIEWIDLLTSDAVNGENAIMEQGKNVRLTF